MVEEKMKPSLSIIIPVYNVEQYLAKCLDSVLVDNQFTGQVICVNDGSTDGSLAILERYAAKYPNLEIISQSNLGLSVARNTGLDKANGDYIFFLDSDDWVFPESVTQVLDATEGEDIIYFNAKLYYEEKQVFFRDYAIQERKHMEGPSYFAAIYNEPHNMSILCVCGGFFKREFLKNNNLRNEPGIYHEDNYFTPQALLAAKDVSCVNVYLYSYRVRRGSITANFTAKHICDELFIARNLYKTYNQHGNVTDVFYGDVCNLYVTLIGEGYYHSIPVHKQWRLSDSKIMLQCAKDDRSRKIAKLTYASPRLAYCYMIDQLPSAVRKFINRFF